jgi:hypothetical protein
VSKLARVIRRASLAAVATAALVAAGCGSTETVTTTVTVTTTPEQTDLGPPRQRVEFGHIKSLTRKGDHYELRFDPAWFLSGETANRAAAEDGAVEPGQPVPNDNYVIEEGHRPLFYLVPPSAKVTVLTNKSNGILKTPVSVAVLAKLVRGETVPGTKLYEPLDSGIWITTDIDKVTEIDQQYRP